MKKLLLLFALICLYNFGYAQGTTCSTAFNLDTSTVNCHSQTISSPNIVWFKFTADTIYSKLTITGNSSGPGIHQTDIYTGNCSSFNLFFSQLSSDTFNVVTLQMETTVGQLYYVKIAYDSNTVSSTPITVCTGGYAATATACPIQSCDYIFQEPFTYFTSICNSCCGGTCTGGGCAGLSTCTSYTNSFLNTIPCWHVTWGTPQIKSSGGNDYAFMWSSYANGVSTGSGGCGASIQATGESIYRDLPINLSPTSLYILEYKYKIETATNNSNLLDNMHVVLTTQGSNTWAGSSNQLVPTITGSLSIDGMSALTNTVFATRRVCFFPPAGTGYNQILFYPQTASTHTCVQQYLDIDDISLSEIKSIPLVNTNTICAGQQVTLSNTCGYSTSLVSYSWTPSTGLSCSTCSATTASPSVTTTYTLTITAVGTATACNSVSNVVTVSVTPIPTVAISPSSSSICPGQSATLTASGANSYTWNPGGSTSNPITVSPSTTTAYTVTGAVSTCTSTSTITLTVNPTPTIAVNSATICPGNSATITASGAGSGGTYSWTPSNGLSATTGTSVVANPSSTTAYTVTGTTSAGCSNSATFTVTVRTPPTLSASASPSTMCKSASTNTSVLSATTNGQAISWSAPTSTTLSCSSCSSPTVTISGFGTYVFTVTATNTITTCTNTTTVSVTVNQIPNVTVTSATICPGSSTVLTASNAATYTWSANAGSATTSTVSVSPTVTTIYTVTGTAANSCTASATSTVAVLSVPAISISGLLCSGQTGTLSVSPTANFTFTWSPTSGTNSVSPSTGTVTTVNSPSGVYSVVGTYSNGCTASANYTTTPTPTISISATTYSFCSASPQTVTLTASGGTTYTWSANAGSVTGSTVAVSPTVTTTYSVTGTTSGCSSTANTTITVVPNPTIAPTATPNPVCQNATATLTATGASTYTWNPGSLNGGSVTVTPTSTTTTIYTVTGTQSGCNGSATISLSVTPSPSVGISATTFTACNYPSPGANTLCFGSTATLTASGVTNYTWNPGSLTGASVVVSPTVSTTYTVTGNSGGCTGTNTLAITVSSCSCPGTALPTLSSTTIVGGTYVLNSSTTISGTVILNNVNIKIAPNVSITIPNGANLQILGSHLSACYNMWQGIVVNQGGRIDITNNATSNALIEDAFVAVDNNPSSTVQTGAPGVIYVDGAVFNCNKTGVRNAFYQDASLSPNYYSSSYFNVSNAVFTCRCGIPFPITTSTLTIYANSGTVTPNPSTPDLNDYYSVANYTSANLRVPNQTLAAFEGINFEDDGYASVQSSHPVQYVYNVGKSGTGNLVLFDNLCYGINATNSSINVTNAAFQFSRQYPGGLFHYLITGGFGINTVNNNVDRYNGLYVTDSKFLELVRDVNSTNYFDFDFQRNVMWSKQVITPYGSGTPISPPRGGYGINIATPRFFEADFINNNLANINNVLIINISNTSGYAGGNGQKVGPMSIMTNTVTQAFTNTTYTNTYVGTGIAISNAIVPTSTNTAALQSQGTWSQINTSRNSISGAYNGIYMGNHQFQEVRVETNTVTLQYYPTNSTEQNQTGINHVNCIYGTGFGEDIYNNVVNGYFASTYTFNTSNQATFEKKKGIWSQYCGNHYVTCNTVSNCGRGFEFTGAHTKTYWAKNTMSHNGEAYSLTNSAAIGTQSTTTNNANDNQWTSTSNSYADTYTDANSFPSNSILWLQGTILPYVPSNNQSAGTAYNGSTLTTSKPACTYSCSLPPTSRMSGSNGRLSNDSTVPDTRFLEDIVLDSLDYPSYAVENSFINKNMTYRIIKRDPSLLSSPILSNFYSSSSNSSWALFSTIEDELAVGNYSSASSMLSGVSATNSIEHNYKRFYEICVDAMQQNYSSSDSVDLMSIASSCPMLNGTIVFQARALRNSLMNGFEQYEDNCPSQGGNSDKAGSSKPSEVYGSLRVYPNPTDGKLSISGLTTHDVVNKIEIADVTGKTVSLIYPEWKSGKVDIHLQVEDGIYFIKCYTAQNGVQVYKLIISK